MLVQSTLQAKDLDGARAILTRRAKTSEDRRRCCEEAKTAKELDDEEAKE